MKDTRGRHPETAAGPLAHGARARAGRRGRLTLRPEPSSGHPDDPFASAQPGAREYREQQRIREAWETRQAAEATSRLL